MFFNLRFYGIRPDKIQQIIGANHIHPLTERRIKTSAFGNISHKLRVNQANHLDTIPLYPTDTILDWHKKLIDRIGLTFENRFRQIQIVVKILLLFCFPIRGAL